MLSSLHVAFWLAAASSFELSLALNLESADFNVTQALIEQGFNLSAVPALANLTDQSSVFACSIAVGHTLPLHTTRSIVDTNSMNSVNLCNPSMAKML